MARTHQEPRPARGPQRRRHRDEPGPRAPLPRRRATAPQWPSWPPCRPNPAGVTVAVIAGHAGTSTAATRQALIAHEKNGTATQVKGSRPGIPDTWTPAVAPEAPRDEARPARTRPPAARPHQEVRHHPRRPDLPDRPGRHPAGLRLQRGLDRGPQAGPHPRPAALPARPPPLRPAPRRTGPGLVPPHGRSTTPQSERQRTSSRTSGRTALSPNARWPRMRCRTRRSGRRLAEPRSSSWLASRPATGSPPWTTTSGSAGGSAGASEAVRKPLALPIRARFVPLPGRRTAAHPGWPVLRRAARARRRAGLVRIPSRGALPDRPAPSHRRSAEGMTGCASPPPGWKTSTAPWRAALCGSCSKGSRCPRSGAGSGGAGHVPVVDW